LDVFACGSASGSVTFGGYAGSFIGLIYAVILALAFTFVFGFETRSYAGR
jgi:hypothetical protein